MKDDEKTILTILAIPGIFLGLLIVLFPIGIWSAFVVQKLYIWFLLPLHLPKLNLWHIWGILTIYNYLKPIPKSEGNPFKKLASDILAALFSGGLALLLGFILKGLMH